jgi:hypothetical protein
MFSLLLHFCSICYLCLVFLVMGIICLNFKVVIFWHPYFHALLVDVLLYGILDVGFIPF